MNRGRKASGGRYHKQRKSKLYEKENQERHVTLGADKIKVMKVRGGNLKAVSLNANTINLLVDGKVKKAEIKSVDETPQNKFLARKNRLMKGTIITTSIGKAKITNRPSQEGCVNGILIKA